MLLCARAGVQVYMFARVLVCRIAYVAVVSVPVIFVAVVSVVLFLC